MNDFRHPETTGPHAHTTSDDHASKAAPESSDIVRRLLKMRAMMQETRNKSAELQGALERFKDRQAKIVNG